MYNGQGLSNKLYCNFASFAFRHDLILYELIMEMCTKHLNLFLKHAVKYKSVDVLLPYSLRCFNIAAECYAESSRTCEAYENESLHTNHQNRFCVPQADRSLSSKGSLSSQNHNSVMHGSVRPQKMYAKVSSDLEYLSSVPSEGAKAEKLSLEVRQVYAELQDISNKLKVLRN